MRGHKIRSCGGGVGFNVAGKLRCYSSFRLVFDLKQWSFGGSVSCTMFDKDSSCPGGLVLCIQVDLGPVWVVAYPIDVVGARFDRGDVDTQSEGAGHGS